MEYEPRLNNLSKKDQEMMNIRTENIDSDGLAEILKNECMQPIDGGENMPLISFESFMKKFPGKSMVEITNIPDYKNMIQQGFILGIDERVYDGKNIGIHLGVDFMVEQGKEVKSVLDGRVVKVIKQFQKNRTRMREIINEDGSKEIRNFPSRDSSGKLFTNEGGFGNLIVIEHIINNEKVYSIYGHLGYTNEIDDCKLGDNIKKGQIIGKIGESFTVENGGWPSHLHFSLTTNPDITGYGGKEELNDIIDVTKVFHLNKTV